VEMIKKFVNESETDPAKAQEVATAKQAKEVAAINKDQSIAEMNNAKAGATQATASYDTCWPAENSRNSRPIWTS